MDQLNYRCTESPRSVLDDFNAWEIDVTRLQRVQKLPSSFYALEQTLEKIENAARARFPAIAADAAKGGEKFLAKLELKKAHKKAVQKAKRQRRAEKAAEEKRLNAIADEQRAISPNSFSRRNRKGIAVCKATSGIKKVRAPYEQRLDQFNQAIEKFVKDKIQGLIKKLEEEENYPLYLYENYSKALEGSKGAFSNDLQAFINNSITEFLLEKEEKNIKASDIVNLYQKEFHILFNQAVVEDRTAYITGPDLFVSNAIEEYTKGKGFGPQHFFDLNIKYRRLCNQYMGDENTEPQFVNFYHMEKVFQEYIRELVDQMSKDGKPMSTGGGAKKDNSLQHAALQEDVEDLD